MATKYIDIKGARENNLKNINVRIPKDKFVIMTGVSGSGKSSLAFDTIYAEGQRRYMESLSSYARQFLGNSEKPDVDEISGLLPAIDVCPYWGALLSNASYSNYRKYDQRDGGSDYGFTGRKPMYDSKSGCECEKRNA